MAGNKYMRLRRFLVIAGLIFLCFTLPDVNAASKQKKLFKKYNITCDKNAELEETRWGYIHRYKKTTLPSITRTSSSNDDEDDDEDEDVERFGSYMGGEINYPASESKDRSRRITRRHSRNYLGKDDVITFRFRTRLYPVDPETKYLEKIIRYDIDKGLAVFEGIYCRPIVCFNKYEPDSGYGENKHDHNNTGIWTAANGAIGKFNKLSVMKKIYRDSKIYSQDLFGINDHKMVIDLKDRVLVHSRNGFKEIGKLKLTFPQLLYYATEIVLNPYKPKRKKCIALEYEYTKYSLWKGGSASNTRDNLAYPRGDVKFNLDRIKKDKDIDAIYHLGRCYYYGTGGADKDYFRAFKYFNEAAHKKHVYAMYQTGMCYLHGLGVEPDPKKAEEWFKLAGKYFYSDALVMAGYCLLKYPRNTRIDDGFGRLMAAAIWQHNPNAYFLNEFSGRHKKITKEFKGLGSSLDPFHIRFQAFGGYGFALIYDHPKALYQTAMKYTISNSRLEKLEKSAEAGYVPAYIELGNCYRAGGKKIVKSGKTAVEWYKKVEEAGLPEAKYQLGICYTFGCGVGKDLEQAKKYFKEAAEKGVPRARIALVILEQDKNTGILRMLAKENKKVDEKLFKALENSKAPLAKYSLGIMRKYGIGAKPDHVKAFRDLLASRSVSPYALLELADCYENGKGTARNYPNAVAMRNAAMKQGLAPAFLQAGKFQYKLRQNRSAVKYFFEAGRRGSAEGAFLYGMIYYKGEGVKKSTSKALKGFKYAASKGYIRAMYMLGCCYYYGAGIRKDPKMAAKIWKQYEEKLVASVNNSLDAPWQGYLPQSTKYSDPDKLPRHSVKNREDYEFVVKYLRKY